MSSWEFANPWFLLLLLLIPIWAMVHCLWKKNKTYTVKAPSIKPFEQKNSLLNYYPDFCFVLRMAVLGLLIIALARPRITHVSTQYETEEGIDIMMVVDVSLSMLARDLKPTRLDALQNVAEEFVSNRLTDRIGMVVYSGEAVTKVPLTTDRNILIDEIRNLNTDELQSGTAIGIGLATGVNNLRKSKAKSKVVILITDGGESQVNYNRYQVYVSPQDAAKIAKQKDIKVYTIGIGTTGFIPLPRGYEHYPQRMFQLDENLLKYIAETANGRYFRATDNQKLEEIYKEINELEKSEINEIKYYTYDEHYRSFLIPALLLIFLDVLLYTTFVRQLR